MTDTPACLYGVDFSGARDAGAKIWIAEATRRPDGLTVTRLFPGKDLPGSGVALEVCLPALRRFVAEKRGCAFGFDFPFALADAATGARPWLEFARSFVGTYPDAAAFRATCRAATGGKEPKRKTDEVAQVPFNAWNLRCYRQTYVGLAGLIAPLVTAREAVVLPMQPPEGDLPWLLEICPASTLKWRQLYQASYKGRNDAQRLARVRILQELYRHEGLILADPAIAERAIANPGGDALDAVIAACTTARAVRDPFRLDDRCQALHPSEGYIYV